MLGGEHTHEATTVAYGLTAAEIARRRRIDAYLKYTYDLNEQTLAQYGIRKNRAERRRQGMKQVRRAWVRGRGSAVHARNRLKLAMRRYRPDGHRYRDAEREVRLRWHDARPNLDLDDDVALDLSPWADQRAELVNADPWSSDYEPPPTSLLLDSAALIAAPRPGPTVGVMPTAA